MIAFIKFLSLFQKNGKKIFFFRVMNSYILDWQLLLIGVLTTCFSKRKKEKMDLVLDKRYENLVDVIHETFTKKYYIVRIPQSKRGQIYLIVRKNKGKVVVRAERGVSFQNV